MPILSLPEPGRPDQGSTWRYLRWLGLRQWRFLALAMLMGTIWMGTIALMPAALGRGIDAITADDRPSLVRWSLVVLALGVLSALAGTARHAFAVRNWLTASFRSATIAHRHALEAGPALTRAVPTGDVVAIFTNDVMRIGGFYDVMGRLAGAVVSYVVVAVILVQTSVRIGLLVLVGGPLLLGSLTLLVRPLKRRQAHQREEAGKLTTLGADTVAGLRVLRGIGGEDAFLHRYEAQSERVRAAGWRVAGLQAALDASQTLIPGIYMVIVLWAGAHATLSGALSAGQLVSLFGYAVFLGMPLRTAVEFLDAAIRANIAAGKVLRILAVASDHDAVLTGPGLPTAQPEPSDDLNDPASGVTIHGGVLTALVSAHPEESAAVIDRLARIGPGPHDATWGGSRLADLPLDDVRARVLVSDSDSRLFTGPLRGELTAVARTETSDAQTLRALAVASGHDILDALADGLDSEVEERGRSLSGGQRQRLAIARALLGDTDVLCLPEPTSAVDAHTEERIGSRLARARLGRTTVVATASPLLLDHADEVVLLRDGLVSATGRHADLLASNAAYRAVVLRGGEE